MKDLLGHMEAKQWQTYIIPLMWQKKYYEVLCGRLFSVAVVAEDEMLHREAMVIHIVFAPESLNGFV